MRSSKIPRLKPIIKNLHATLPNLGQLVDSLSPPKINHRSNLIRSRELKSGTLKEIESNNSSQSKSVAFSPKKRVWKYSTNNSILESQKAKCKSLFKRNKSKFLDYQKLKIDLLELQNPKVGFSDYYNSNILDHQQNQI